MANANASSNRDHTTPWAQRGFVMATTLVAVIALAGVGLLIAGGGNSDKNGAVEKGVAAAPSVAAKDPNSSVCGLPPGSQRVPAVPPDATWELVGTVAAPTAPGIGPGIKQNKRRLCFAHSPTGALFAAVNFVAVASQSPDDTAVLRELTADGRARDESLKANANSSREGSGGGLQVAGFRMSAYSAPEATVDLAFAVEAKGYVRLPLLLRWQRGDWKVGVTTAQGPFANYEALSNLSGYVPWSGT